MNLGCHSCHCRTAKDGEVIFIEQTAEKNEGVCDRTYNDAMHERIMDLGITDKDQRGYSVDNNGHRGFEFGA